MCHGHYQDGNELALLQYDHCKLADAHPDYGFCKQINKFNQTITKYMKKKLKTIFEQFINVLEHLNVTDLQLQTREDLQEIPADHLVFITWQVARMDAVRRDKVLQM